MRKAGSEKSASAPEAVKVSLAELRRFLLRRQGLLGAHRFSGKKGALEYVRQAGCIQFDPIDICGRNAELTLQSRVKGFTKLQLYELLYKDRALIDYADKELSILPTEDFPLLSRWRASARRNASEFPGIEALAERARRYILENGPVSSATLPIEGEIKWNSAIHWSGNWHGRTNAARSVLEQMYSDGRLVIHHKEGTRKFYDLAERHIPADILNAPDPNAELIDHIKWGVLRRIGAIGALWDRRSDSLLGIWGMDAALRRQAFSLLALEGSAVPLAVPEIGVPLYIKACDLPLLNEMREAKRFKRRCEFIAPLDPLMWDRKLIEAVFGFRYRWEIYTPAEKRQFGYYVLPIVYGDGFAGRIEAARRGSAGTDAALEIMNIWLEREPEAKKTFADLLEDACTRLARFNGCEKLRFLPPAAAVMNELR